MGRLAVILAVHEPFCSFNLPFIRWPLVGSGLRLSQPVLRACLQSLETQPVSQPGLWLRPGSGVADWDSVLAGWALGLAGWASGLASWASGLAGWSSGLTGWASGLTGWASGLAGWTSGLAG